MRLQIIYRKIELKSAIHNLQYLYISFINKVNLDNVSRK